MPRTFELFQTGRYVVIAKRLTKGLMVESMGTYLRF